MLELITDNIPVAVTIATTIAGTLISQALRLKAKLDYSIDHSHLLLVDSPNVDQSGQTVGTNRQGVWTSSITLSNPGLLPAKLVAATFNWQPQIYNVMPPRPFTTEESALNRYSIKFDSLAPGERVTIVVMAINRELPVLTAVRAENVVGRQISMVLLRHSPKWLLITLGTLMAVGALTVIYGVAVGVERVVEGTAPRPSPTPTQAKQSRASNGEAQTYAPSKAR